MPRASLLLCLSLLFVLRPASAEETTAPPNHSIVNLVFVAAALPHNHGMGMRMGGPQVAQARIGDIIMPVDQISPISISIDGEFVGHALVGIASITPTFVLKVGTHEFSFSCDGYLPVSMKLKVIGTGSEQYLIVRMQKDSQPNQKVNASGPTEHEALEDGATTR